MTYQLTDRTPVTVRANASTEVRIAASRLLGVMVKAGSRVKALVELSDIEASRGIHVSVNDQLVSDVNVFTHARGIMVCARDNARLLAAIYTMLREIGYVQVLPGETWTLLPKLYDATDQAKKPVSFDVKSCSQMIKLFYSYGSWPHRQAALDEWTIANYPQPEFELRSGHAFGDYYRRNKAFFDATVDGVPFARLALVNGKRGPGGIAREKFCLSRPDVRQEFVVQVNARWVRNPSGTVSIMPSDGRGWCECASCVAMGPPSDRMVELVNSLAQDKDVAKIPIAFAAYDQHAAPPSKAIEHKRCYVQVATRFNGDLDEVAARTGWVAKGAIVGARSYGQLWLGHYDMPGEREFDPLPDGKACETQETSDAWLINGGGARLLQYADRLWPETSRRNAAVDFIDAAQQPISSRSIQQMRNAANEMNLVDRGAHEFRRYLRYVEAFREWILSGRADDKEAAVEQAAANAGYFGMVNSMSWANVDARKRVFGADPRSREQLIEDMGTVATSMPLAPPYVELEPLDTVLEYAPGSKLGREDYGEGRRLYWTDAPLIVQITAQSKPVTVTSPLGTTVVPAGSTSSITVYQIFSVADGGGRSTVRLPVWQEVLCHRGNVHFGRKTMRFLVEAAAGSGKFGVQSHVSVGQVVSPSGKATTLPTYEEMTMFDAEPGVWTLKDVVGYAYPVDGTGPLDWLAV